MEQAVAKLNYDVVAENANEWLLVHRRCCRFKLSRPYPEAPLTPDDAAWMITGLGAERVTPY